MAVLVFAFGWLALAFGTVALWNRVVHENGRYTLAETTFYFSHFLREVPGILVMAGFLVAMAGTWRRYPQPSNRFARRWWAVLSAAMAVALVILATTVVASSEGFGEVMLNVLQYRTRDNATTFGSHWEYHLLHLVWFGVACTVLAGPLRSPAMWRVSWGLLCVGTVVFGLSAAPFVDIRYVAHQMREIVTHGLVTLPATWWVASQVTGAAPTASAHTPAVIPAKLGKTRLAALAAAMLIPLYLTVVSLAGNVRHEMQLASGYAGAVAAHFFEHTLDYALVILLVTAALAARADGPTE